ncbi:MAG TPA: glycerophosphodiester phosphodiesterase [Kofleriaceae bacterium]
MGKTPPLAVLSRFVPHLGRLGRAERWRRVRRPRIWAHRGASAHEPENTLEAFELARTAGADGIELDVRLDREGNVVVFHDRELQRLCGRPGRMEELSSDERKTLRVRGAQVPLLEDVFHMLGDLDVNVEIKSNHVGRNGALVEATAKVIRQSGLADQVLVSSFDPFSLLQFYRQLPDVALGFLFGADQTLPIRKGWLARAMGATVLHPEHTLCTADNVKAWHTSGRPINTWTVDDPDEMLRLAELGVDGIFTNDPALAVSVLGS